MEFKNFVFSPFQENTFVLFDETKECVVIDPGNFFPNENDQLDEFIEKNGLKLVHIINTHNHLDHMFGARYIADKYKVKIAAHPDDQFWAEHFLEAAKGYGLPITLPAPIPEVAINDGDIFKFGNTLLEVIHVPGHSPGGVAFYNKEAGCLFCGDILFQNSIGRTDFPGGDHEQLISGITTKLWKLPDNTRVFSGHGPETSIGYEKATNPYLR